MLAAYYCPEPASDRAQKLLARESDPVISWLTGVELMSALSKKVRQRGMSRRDARRIADLFRTHLSDGYFTVLPAGGADFEKAADALGTFDNSLRALDALHVAVARRASLPIATADRALANVAKRFDINVVFLK